MKRFPRKKKRRTSRLDRLLFVQALAEKLIENGQGWITGIEITDDGRAATEDFTLTR
jgi:hypothetical protein